MRAHPHLYEINTWPWLDGLSRHAGRELTLGGVPDRELDHLQRRGVDIVYLMGIWKRSAFGRQLARGEPLLTDAFNRALPGWTARDVVGSAYCISGYEPDRRIGTWEDLADIRARLHARGMLLMRRFHSESHRFRPSLDRVASRSVRAGRRVRVPQQSHRVSRGRNIVG